MCSPDCHPAVLLYAIRLREVNQIDIYMHSPQLLYTRWYQAWLTPILQRVDGVVPSAFVSCFGWKHQYYLHRHTTHVEPGVEWRPWALLGALEYSESCTLATIRRAGAPYTHACCISWGSSVGASLYQICKTTGISAEPSPTAMLAASGTLFRCDTPLSQPSRRTSCHFLHAKNTDFRNRQLR